MRALIALVLGVVLGVGFLWVVDNKDIEARAAENLTPEAVAAKVERGRYLAIAGDCVACHTREGGEEFAGGLPLLTPFGTIYAPNITPDKESGIGDWTPSDVYRALHLGKDKKKRNLYPAFSYHYYTKVSRTDAEDIGHYLLSLQPVKYEAPKNKLAFPFNIRFMLKGWNLFNFRPEHFKSDASQSAQWNRGKYLVDGLGHCGACHTPKNIMFGDVNSRNLQGGVVEHWFASDLTNSKTTGLGNWTEEDIVAFLQTGTNPYSNAYGTMTDVVRHSTSHMTAGDLAAIAHYLKTVPGGPDPKPAPKPADAVLTAGKATFDKNCQDCHLEDGTGIPGLYPPLAGNVNMKAVPHDSVVHIILAGNGKPVVGEGMPGFPKLTDKEVADMATYVRYSWGNTAGAVSEADVKKLRNTLTKSGQLKPAPAAAPAAPEVAPAADAAAVEAAPVEAAPAEAVPAEAK